MSVFSTVDFGYYDDACQWPVVYDIVFVYLEVFLQIPCYLFRL